LSAFKPVKAVNYKKAEPHPRKVGGGGAGGGGGADLWAPVDTRALVTRLHADYGFPHDARTARILDTAAAFDFFFNPLLESELVAASAAILAAGAVVAAAPAVAGGAGAGAAAGAVVSEPSAKRSRTLPAEGDANNTDDDSIIGHMPEIVTGE
jgi:hypothetical protein